MEPVHILLVEDNEGDILLTTEAFENARIINRISIARDGKEAMDFLEACGEEPGSLPDILLLDINLPRKNGHEVLQFIKANEKYKHIPVIMLTTSSSDTDIMQSYKNYANCFITKPVDVATFLNVVSQIENYWISIVTLPVKK